MTKLIDSHAHLALYKEENIMSILERAKKNNISKIVNVITNEKSLHLSLELKRKYNWIYNTAATSPHDVEKEGESFFPLVKKCAKEKKLVAIGETGLDYYYNHSPKQTQKIYFEKYLALAKTYSLPVIIHCRNAFEDLFAISKKFLPINAVLHCFTGTIEQAQRAIQNNWYVSFSGILTFKNSRDLQDTAKNIDLEKILIETDSPFLAPQNYRGKKNEPAYLIEIAKKIAELKNINLNKVIEITSTNAKKLFSIS